MALVECQQAHPLPCYIFCKWEYFSQPAMDVRFVADMGATNFLWILLEWKTAVEMNNATFDTPVSGDVAYNWAE